MMMKHKWFVFECKRQTEKYNIITYDYHSPIQNMPHLHRNRPAKSTDNHIINLISLLRFTATGISI